MTAVARRPPHPGYISSTPAPRTALRIDSEYDRRGDNTVRTVGEAIIDFLGCGNHLDTACALVHVQRDSVYAWLRTGALHHNRMLTGRARRRDLTSHQRRCVDFSLGVRQAMARAEAGWLGQLHVLGTEGAVQTTVVEKSTFVRDPETGDETDHVRVDRTVTTRTLPPDARVLMWMLERRLPNSWRARSTVEIDLDSPGVGDAPAEDPVDQLDKQLEEIARRRRDARDLLAGAIDVEATEATDAPAVMGDDPL